MSSKNNVFQCGCSPQHDFHSQEEFNRHFASIYHKYYECASKTLYQDYQRAQQDLRKLQEERDMWKEMFQEQFHKTHSSSG